MFKNKEIINKEEFISERFSNTQVELFKTTETICADQSQYLQQYVREIGLVLTKNV